MHFLYQYFQCIFYINSLQISKHRISQQMSSIFHRINNGNMQTKGQKTLKNNCFQTKIQQTYHSKTPKKQIDSNNEFNRSTYHEFYRSTYHPSHNNKQQFTQNQDYKLADKVASLKSYYSENNRQNLSYTQHLKPQKYNQQVEVVGVDYLLKNKGQSKSKKKHLEETKSCKLLNIQKNWKNTNKINENLFQSPKSPKVFDERSKMFISKIRQQMKFNSPKSHIKIDQNSETSSQHMVQSDVRVANIIENYTTKNEEQSQQDQSLIRQGNQKYNRIKGNSQTYQLNYEIKILQNQIELKTYQVQKLTKQLNFSQAKYQNNLNSLMNEHRLALNKKEHQKQILIKEFQHFKKSIQSLEKSKLQKQKHFMQQINKYNAKLIESESLRSATSLDQQQKLRQKLQKKEKVYKQLFQQKQNTYKVSLNQYKKIINGKQNQIKELKEIIQISNQNKVKLEQDICKLTQQVRIQKSDNKFVKDHQMQINRLLQNQNKSLKVQVDKIIKQKEEYEFRCQSSQTLVRRLQKQNQSLKQQINQLGQHLQSFKFKYQRKEIELNQTNEDHYQQTYKLKELIFQKEQQFQQIKISINHLSKQVQNIKAVNLTLQQKLSQQKQISNHNLLMYEKCSFQCQKKNQQILTISQQLLYLQNQNSTILKNFNNLQQQYKQFKIKIQNEITYNSFQNNISKTESIYSENNTIDWVVRIQGLESQIGQLMQNFKKQKNNLIKSHQKDNNQLKDKIQKTSKLLLKKDNQINLFKQKLNLVQLSKKKIVQQMEQRLMKSNEQIKNLKDSALINQNFKKSIKIKFQQERKKLEQKIFQKQNQFQHFKKSQFKRSFDLKEGFHQILLDFISRMNNQIKRIQASLKKIFKIKKSTEQLNNKISQQKEKIKSQQHKQKQQTQINKKNKLQAFSVFYQQFIRIITIKNIHINDNQNEANKIQFFNKQNQGQGLHFKLLLLQSYIKQIIEKITTYSTTLHFNHQSQELFKHQLTQQLSDLKALNQKLKLNQKQQQIKYQGLSSRFDKLKNSYGVLEKDFQLNVQKLQEYQNKIKELQVKFKIKQQQNQQYEQQCEKLNKNIKKLKIWIDLLQKQEFQKQLRKNVTKEEKLSEMQLRLSQIQLQQNNLIKLIELNSGNNNQNINIQSQVTKTYIQQAPILGIKQKTPKKQFKKSNMNKQKLLKQFNNRFFLQNCQINKQLQTQKSQQKDNLSLKIQHYESQLIPQYQLTISQLYQKYRQKQNQNQMLQIQLQRFAKNYQQKENKFAKNSHDKLVDLQTILKKYQNQNQNLFNENKDLYLKAQKLQQFEQQLSQQTFLAKNYKQDLIKKQTLLRDLNNSINLQTMRHKEQLHHLNMNNQQLKIRVDTLESYNSQLLISIGQKTMSAEFPYKHSAYSQRKDQMQKKQKCSTLLFINQRCQNRELQLKFEQLEAKVQVYEKMLKDKEIENQNQRRRYEQIYRDKQELIQKVEQLIQQIYVQFEQMQKMGLQIEQLKFINVSKSLNLNSSDFKQKQTEKHCFSLRNQENLDYKKIRFVRQKKDIISKDQQSEKYKHHQISFSSLG